MVHGELRAGLERASHPIGANDLLIAAHALALGHTVVSVNQVRFNFSAIATRRHSDSEWEGLSGWRLAPISAPVGCGRAFNLHQHDAAVSSSNSATLAPRHQRPIAQVEEIQGCCFERSTCDGS